MEYRRLGKTDIQASVISIGTWAMGADWGPVDDDQSLRALDAAADAGVTFFDTADVYGDGHSERLLARFRRERHEPIVIATKIGRRAPLDLDEYTPENFAAWIDRSRANLDVDRLDLVQLHCLPTDIYYRPEIFAALDSFVSDGRIASYGVSVERVEEGLKAIEYPNLGTVQIIFNIFRQRPAELFLREAMRRDVGVIVRVPLASGLLTGKFSRDSEFSASDHRNFNRYGESFDVGETFAGVDYDTALEVIEELRPLVPPGTTMAQLALRWILMENGVSTVIPGAKNAGQAGANAAAAELPALPPSTMERVAMLYRDRVAPLVHQRW
ncbi:MAG TPA: aldo/keto reductase [Candidatus Dormibacteraeota bacterium]|nr:aldo/keto reductase [Candidatus Dormibacteraeota bacterium]